MVQRLIHICERRTAAGSRIHMQQRLFPGEVVFNETYLPRARLCRELALQPDGSSMVFHQASSLPACALTAQYARIRGRDWRIVFDLHDLIERPRSSKRFERPHLGIYSYEKLMRALPSLGVRLITVSKGLATITAQNTGSVPGVVFSIPPGATPPSSPSAGLKAHSKVAYFGMIRPDRLQISAAEALVNHGKTVDIFGRFFANAPDGYRRDLLKVIARTGGSYRGPYSPSDLSFLDDYSACLMLFSSTTENFRYGMPNKLFQAVRMRKVSIVSDHLSEARDTFESTGAVQTLSSFLLSTQDADWDKADGVIADLAAESQQAYLDAIGA